MTEQKLRIGIIKEGKVPVDQRVPLSPGQCRQIQQDFPSIEILVQKSDVRKFTDDQYKSMGLHLVEELHDADIIMGVKEVPTDMLISGKTYFFFSHTIKKQPYNAKLLRAIIDKNIRLIDWELLTEPRGARVIGFGRYAGVVGAYNAFRAMGVRTGAFELKPAHLCDDRVEMEAQLSKVVMPEGYKMVMTGTGRVGKGALEIISKVTQLKRVTPAEFLAARENETIYTVLNVDDYYQRPDGTTDKAEIYHNPSGYVSVFQKFAATANMFIAGHFWDTRGAFLFTKEDMRDPRWKIDVVADISCDIDGPVACTIRPSTIDNAMYGYDIATGTETEVNAEGSILVMAVDNLPCELPKDASVDFGNELIKHVIPQLMNEDENNMIERATIAENGELTHRYRYLKDYADSALV